MDHWQKLVAGTLTLAIATGATAKQGLEASLKPGATIVLPAGDHPRIVLRNHSFNPPVTIDASKARVKGVSLHNVNGLHWRGGTIIAPEGPHPSHPRLGYAVEARNSANLSFQDVKVTDAGRAFVFANSEGLTLRRLDIDGVRAEGVNLGVSHKALIEDVRCANFTPTPKVRDEKGKMIKDGDHPDCIQAWSRAGAAPLTDIIVRRVTARGQMQGIFFGNRGRGGDGAGYRRVLIEDNDIEVTYPNGIMLSEASESIVRNNRVATMKGGRYQNTTIRLPGGDVISCGNKVEGPGRARAGAMTGKCKPAELTHNPAKPW